MARAPGSSPAVTTLQLGACAGVLTGLAELAHLAVRKYVRHLFLFQGVDVVWMKPVGELVLFVACGLCLVAFGRVRRREVSLAWAVGIYASLGSLSLLLLYASLHRVAAAVLALGVGVQAGRLVRSRGGGRRWRLPGAIAAS